jgi:ADP-ribose pyrophosphatase
MSEPGKILRQVVFDGQPPQVLAQGTFLTLIQRRARTCFQDGSFGQWYVVESVHPRFHDAVVLLLFSLPGLGQQPMVALRQGARPCLCPVEERSEVLENQPTWEQGFWELPAGGLESRDLEPGGQGVKGRASQEAWEEAGLRVAPEEFQALGAPPWLAPAFCPERLHYLAAAVNPALAQPPPGDGHPMEEGSCLRFLPLDQALDCCRQGQILDIKTEVGLHRPEGKTS